MDLYASDESVAALEAEAARDPDTALLAELGWHLRQRDSARSAQIAAGVERALERSNDPLIARVRLTRAECLMLQFRLREARGVLAGVPEVDPTIRGDKALLSAAIANAEGEPASEIAQAGVAREAYETARDRRRAAFASAVELTSTAKRNPSAAQQEIARLRGMVDDPALHAHLDYAGAVIHFIAGDFPRAIELLTPGAEVAPRFGAAELGLRSLLTIAAALSNLGDWDESSRAGEQALERARALRWPRWIAGSLAHLGRLFTYMENTERAIEVLNESVALFESEKQSRHYAMALFYLGDAHLHAGNAAVALESIEQSESIARRLGVTPEVAANLATGARALARLGREEEALAKAQAALDLARSCGAKLWEAEALRALAEIGRERAPREALAHLQAALEVSKTLGGHHETSQLWAEISRVHEQAGDLAAALAAERTARTEQLAEQRRRAANQALVSRVRHEMETLAVREAEMRRLATTDALTGLANRRQFLAAAEAEIARASRHGAAIGLIVADIDKFKAINDTYGHAAGDAVLAAVARTLAANARPGDVAGRLGGEEFAVLLPGADIGAAAAVAERLRASVESLAIDCEGTRVPVTISLGCASRQCGEGDSSGLYKNMFSDADAALYAAKRDGRNRAVAAGACAASSVAAS